MTSDAPGQEVTLSLARKAHRCGDFATALEHYDYFFEHALDEDLYALYGVRLSYCLDEWAELGQQFPPATDRLRLKKESALRLLKASRDPERFHDYIAICHYLKCSDEPIQQFLSYHRTDPDLSRSIVRFIWDDLVDAEQWDICSSYVDDSQERYRNALGRFDEAMSVCDSDPDLGGEEFAGQIEEWYVRDVRNLALVLCNAARAAEAEGILTQVKNDCIERGRLGMLGRIREQLAL
jgi:tetratricopeptide (TPR) repeat protein